MSAILADSHGRRFSYLRLSVTDACNFKCVYCLPNGYKKPESGSLGAHDPLSLNEIRNLVAGFAELGTWKVRITGGEPTLRADLFDIITAVNETPGIRKVALSTNGHRLKENAAKLRLLGVSALNVSVDTLDPIRFRAVTGRDSLKEILEGIEEALRVGFSSVKINAVLMKGVNDGDIRPFLEWIKNLPLTVRWIELMPTGTNQVLFGDKHVKSDELIRTLELQGWMLQDRAEADGPAREFSHPDYLGRVGVIAPYSKDFCASCNRLRVSSQGGLQLCLFGEGRHSLRAFLQSPSQREELKNEVHTILGRKKISHFLQNGVYGDNKTFSAIGG